uniref:Uncharacterized protein n=1 Tax=Oryza punctata TaxID=4537 RepID=A0A0E0LH69_ORYPU
MEAKRRCDEKFNQILQKLEETISVIRAITAILKAASSSTPMALLPPVTTKCSTICSSSNAKPDLTMAVLVTCATSAVSSVELVATVSTTGITNIDTIDCSNETHAKGGTDQPMVEFLAKTCMSEGVLALDASTKVSSRRSIAEMDLITLMPTECSTKCPEHDSKAKWLGLTFGDNKNSLAIILLLKEEERAALEGWRETVLQKLIRVKPQRLPMSI